jgi:hypothetical protein
VEPATFERCAEIREWLSERGVQRMTLLVIPARDLHPLGERSPEVVRWLEERRRAGDSIAQHGFQHTQARAGMSVRERVVRLGSGANTEFIGLDIEETQRALNAGWRVLKLAGIEPHGFVAPGYAYTPALRTALAQRFQWWGELLAVRRAAPRAGLGTHLRVPPGGLHASHTPIPRLILPPPLSPSSSDWRHRGLARALAQIETLLPNAPVRLDVHPGDFDRRAGVEALEGALRKTRVDRRAVTYDELALADPVPARGRRGGFIHVRRRPARAGIYQQPRV